jgi:hypothetical protein
VEHIISTTGVRNCYRKERNEATAGWLLREYLVLHCLSNIVLVLPCGHVFFARFGAAQFHEVAIDLNRRSIEEGLTTVEAISKKNSSHFLFRRVVDISSYEFEAGFGRELAQ